MDAQTLLWVLGGMQTVTWLLIGWVKMDIKNLWKRADCHGHMISCEKSEKSGDCKVTTKGVIIPTGGRE